jgi:hypothetical protein
MSADKIYVQYFVDFPSDRVKKYLEMSYDPDTRLNVTTYYDLETGMLLATTAHLPINKDGYLCDVWIEGEQ